MSLHKELHKLEPGSELLTAVVSCVKEVTYSRETTMEGVLGLPRMIVAIEALAAKAAQEESSVPATRRRLPAGQQSRFVCPEVLVQILTPKQIRHCHERNKLSF